MTAPLADIEACLRDFSRIIIHAVHDEKRIGRNYVFISGRIDFLAGGRLEFSEFHDLSVPTKVKYRYHLMDSGKQMVFRYDNAPHFPQLTSFPHHKHLPTDVIATVEPDFRSVLVEVAGLLKSQ